MNDKYMTLFKKTNEQLEKELHKRGIKNKITKSVTFPSNGQLPGYDLISRERAIAEIIYKDAFDAGRSLKAKEMIEENTEDYLITSGKSDKWKVSLNTSQVRLLNWLIVQGLLGNTDYTEFEDFKYEDVGRI